MAELARVSVPSVRAVRPLNGAGDETRDTLFGGEVVLHQPPRGGGYRVNVDALLLAAFAAKSCGIGGARVAYDLGAGVGAVGLALLHFGAARRVVLVEVDRDAARIAQKNLAANGWDDRGDVVCADVVDAARAHPADAQLVVCNPPYFAPGRGRPAADPARARARSGDLAAFTGAARVLAGRRARVCFVYPVNEATTLLAALRTAGLEPKRMRFVHASAGAPARIAMVEAVGGKPGGLTIEPPLFERVGAGYSAELEGLLAWRRAPPVAAPRA